MRRKRNVKKRMAAVLGVCTLVGTMGLGGLSLAYLTDAETVSNTFTIGGDISIELLEEEYPGNDDPEVKDLVPNEEVPKDPKVENVGSNDAIVYMVVDSPMEAITLINDNGTPVYTLKKTETRQYTDDEGVTQEETVEAEVPQRKVDEIFWFKDSADELSAHSNSFDANWTMLTAKSMYVIIDRSGNETQVVFTEDGDPDANSDLDDETLSETLFTGAAQIFRTDVDDSNRLSKRQKALQQLYASLPSDSTLVHRYVFAYNTDIQGSTENDEDQVRASAKLGDAVDEHQTTKLFDKVQMKNFIENEIGQTTQSIGVRAYAIQADEILENSADLSDDLTDITNLNHIYDVFIAQNSESSDQTGLKVIDLREADSVENTRAGESERKPDGNFEDPSVSHVNRWNTDDNVESPNNIKP